MGGVKLVRQCQPSLGWLGFVGGRMKVLEVGWEEKDLHERVLPIVEEMIAARGWITNSYAQVEFLLADIIVKCRQFRENEDLNNLQLPFGIDGRVNRIRDLCTRLPLNAHADNLLPLLDRLMELEDARHFFTHGFMSVHIEKGTGRVGMHLRRYVQPKRHSRETRAEMFVLPEQMSDGKTRWVIFAQTAVETFRRIYEQLGLESHDVTEGNPAIFGSPEPAG
jgi:hypothetical protein